eukprot:6005930-Prymnesium_polylepis.2
MMKCHMIIRNESCGPDLIRTIGLGGTLTAPRGFDTAGRRPGLRSWPLAFHNTQVPCTSALVAFPAEALRVVAT